MRFEFATASAILFGSGLVKEVGALAARYGTRAFLVTGRDPYRAMPVVESLTAAGVASVSFSVAGEPTTDLVHAAVQQARGEGCDVVIGLGGGSVIDAAKAVAGMLTNPGELLDYLEVVGRGQPLQQPAAPWIAIPTTAGAGAEVTRNAVLASTADRVKASLRSSYLVARVALVDPQLTLKLPPASTASTGLDALTQLIEPFVSCRAQPLTDALCRDGMVRIARSLRPVFAQGDRLELREDMALAALFSGMALANAGLGAVHGFAAPIGGGFNAPHGAVCAALLPHAMDINVRALRQRQPESEALQRYDEIARLLTGRPQADAAAGIAWVQETCAALGIPRLGTYGITENDVGLLCERAAMSSSMRGNPLPLTADEIWELLQRAL